MDLIEERGSLSSPREEQTSMVVRAWTKCLKERPPWPGPGCLSPLSLFLFHAGALAVEESRQTILHLASCSHCRAQENALHQQRGSGSARAFNLAYLRQTARQDPDKVRSALEEVKVWLGEALRVAVGLAGQPETLVAALVDDRNKPAGQVELRWDQHPRLDRQGRLRLKLALNRPMPGLSLNLVIRDMDYLLDLATVPLMGEAVQIIADCAFLDLPAGDIPGCLFQATVGPAELGEKLGRPQLLPRLQDIMRQDMALADRWDAILEALAGQGDRWRGWLASEMLGNPDALAAGLDALQSVREVILEFAAVWRHSNGEEPPHVQEILAGVEEIRQSTRQKRRRAVDSVVDATIATKRSQRKKDTEKIEVE